MKTKISASILGNNNQFIGFNKPSGLPLQKAKNETISVHEMLMAYCKHTLYVVHRIDQPVSGAVVFAKNKKTAALLSGRFKEGEVRKTYYAVVERNAEVADGELRHFLKKDGKTNKSELADEADSGARECVLTFKKLAEIDHYMLLEVTPKTGRHHQIRAQLSAIGVPIKGDTKYGAKRSNQDRSIHLHAHKLGFKHPISGQSIEFEAPINAGDPVWDAFGEKLGW